MLTGPVNEKMRARGWMIVSASIEIGHVPCKRTESEIVAEGCADIGGREGGVEEVEEGDGVRWGWDGGGLRCVVGGLERGSIVVEGIVVLVVGWREDGLVLLVGGGLEGRVWECYLRWFQQLDRPPATLQDYNTKSNSRVSIPNQTPEHNHALTHRNQSPPQLSSFPDKP